LADQNYDQLENFLEFEEFIGNSYYTVFVTEYVEKAKAAINTLTSQQFETASEFYAAGRTFAEN
jgi:hypothetical protein